MYAAKAMSKNRSRFVATLVPVLSAFALAMAVVACSSSSTSNKGTSGGDGGSGGADEGGGGGGGGSTCKVADGTYSVHSTAVDNSDGGSGCQAPNDMTVTYPLDASAGAGGSSNCTTSSDDSTCTTTTVCTSMTGSISSKLTTVTKINSDGKGYTITLTQLVTSNGEVSTDCTITSVATPQ